MIAYYSTLAVKYGDLTACYKNAICLITDEKHIYEAMEVPMESEKFIITSKPHDTIIEGFPLESLSMDCRIFQASFEGICFIKFQIKQGCCIRSWR